MASSRFFLAFVLLFVLAIHSAESHRLPNFSTSTAAINCGGACEIRCSKSSRMNLCKRACGTCCARCKCVPPGTYGNEDSCLCYATMTTRGGVHKCP